MTTTGLNRLALHRVCVLVACLEAALGATGCAGGTGALEAGDGRVDLMDAAAQPDGGHAAGSDARDAAGTSAERAPIAMDGPTETHLQPPIDAAPDLAMDAPPDIAADLPAEPMGDSGMVRDASRADTLPVDGPRNPGCAACAAYGASSQAGRVSAASLGALSGMAVSRRNAGVLYVHNDRSRSEFFAVSEAGALLGTFSFAGAPVIDLEDMAVGSCPSSQSCVYLADIGGNTSTRTTYSILRFAEPGVAVGQAAAPPVALVPERLTFSYPDGPHNAESLLIDSGADLIYVITKLDAGPSTVYRVPAEFGAAAVVAEKVTVLTVPRVADGPATGSSAHPCGGGFLLRTNTILYEFRTPLGSPLASAFAATPTPVPAAVETQGEAVAYRADGRGYFTTSEGPTPPINQTACQ